MAQNKDGGAPSKMRESNRQQQQHTCSKTTIDRCLRMAALILVATYLHFHLRLLVGLNSDARDVEQSTLFGAPPIRIRNDAPSDGRGGRRTLHMIQCVFGNDAEFIDEWEISFKSVIFNAPLDGNLHVHIICDPDGAKSVEERIRKANLPGSRWRQRVSVTVTNLRSKENNVRQFLRRTILNEKNGTGHESAWMDGRLGLGSFLRLFAYKYMLEYVPNNQLEQKEEMAFYLDTDVVIISNLNHLVSTSDDVLTSAEKEGKPPPLWVWGQGSSGFMGINVMQFDEFWDAVRQCDSVREDPYPKKNDQWLLGLVVKCSDRLAGNLPDPSPWSVHIGSGYRNRPNGLHMAAGMLHLQNPDAKTWYEEETVADKQRAHRPVPPCTDANPRPKRGTCIDRYYVDKFCFRGEQCINRGDRDANLKFVRNTWGIADYYVRLSWDWTIYQAGESRVPPRVRGHNFTLVVRDATSDF
ncbi:hypothetical protein ACHAWF_004309 [Thalassiosira exigua]